MDFDAEIDAMSERAIALELANKRREYQLEGFDGPRAESNLRMLERQLRKPKKFGKGGRVRGAGIAKRGVRKAKMR